MSVIKKFMAFLCLTGIAFCLILPPAAGAAYDGIYCIAINDAVQRDMITAENMPFPSGGYLYVPYTVFDGNANGEFELSCNNNRPNDTLTIFTKQKALIFKISDGNSSDNTGAQHSARAISRDGRIFVPVRFVCDFFGLTYSYLTVEITGGTIPVVRISNSLRILADDQFASAVSLSHNIADRVAEYQRSLAPSPSPSTPVPTVPTTPLPSTPSPSPTTPTGEQPPDHSDIRVYLSFEVTGEAAGLNDILNTLAARQVSGLFLFRADELARRGNEVRHVLGRGHRIGMLLGEEDAQQDYENGIRLLGHIARADTRIVALPGGAERAEGWAVWAANVSSRDGGSVNTRVNALRAAVAAQRSPVRIALGCDTADAAVTGYFLRDLFDARYDLRPVTEASLLPAG